MQRQVPYAEVEQQFATALDCGAKRRCLNMMAVKIELTDQSQLLPTVTRDNNDAIAPLHRIL